ncbi:MAG TPA: PEP-CTERM sorting domain-containing protein [Planctomycetes bacterium]|nr:PEP-CTERM sorting domain-containing protein [Planctomycetota bacterium]
METKEENVKTHVTLTTAVCVLTLILSTSAQGVVIPLSSHTSDVNVPASWLDASMKLSVNQAGEDWELTLAVTNLTPEVEGEDIAFKISELFFSTSAPITNLTLDEVMGGNINNWGLTLDMDNILVGPYGLFDISIISAGHNVEWIDPGDTVSFKMTIEGDASSYTDTDFYDLSEWHTDCKWLSYGAAKFWGGGPENLSAKGAYVPEPATILLLGLGTLCLLRKRR